MGKCDICNKETDIYESRFLYFTCKEHENIPPVERIIKEKKDVKSKKLRSSSRTIKN